MTFEWHSGPAPRSELTWPFPREKSLPKRRLGMKRASCIETMMKMTHKSDGDLDRSAAIPLYHQIFLQMRDEILGGQRGFGSTLPTEQDMAGMYAVSRITARRALAELAQHHFVARKRRVGTTVIFRPPAKPFEANIDQAVDTLLEFGQATTVRVLSVGKEAASPTVAEAMGVASGQPLVRAVRVRYRDGAAIGYVVSYVPASLGRHMTPAELRRTPILRLIQNAGQRLGKATQTIAAIPADSAICHPLGVEPRSAILRITRTTYDPSGKPILLTIAHYRSDRYQLRIDLQH